tara:strand:- start:2417 stop:2887 length:471 start_codon:yes stop_codon:yes gene_type:complete
MYAIVEIAGQQFKVEKDQQVYVNRLDNKEGSKVEFDNVLLIDNDGKIKVGAPAIIGAKVTAKVVSHLKGDKVVVFKKKRRKGYRVKNGHRQSLTEILIQKIEEKAAAKKSPEKKAEPKVETKAKSATKKTAAKKPVAKKTTTKKTTAKKAAPKKAE